MSGSPVPRQAIGGEDGPERPARLPAAIARLCARLPEGRLADWQQALSQARGPDDPLLNRFIVAQPASGLARQLAEVTRAWRTEAPALPGSALALALAATRAVPRPIPVQPVVSGPMGPTVPARLTSGVALDVIRSAESSLLIASFAAYGVEDAVSEIGRAADRGVAVDLLLEESTQASAAFSDLGGRIRIWHRPTGVLHAKLIAADRHTALLGSANLTDRALSENIELGIVLRGSGTVGPLVEHFHWLISPENGVMRRA